MCDVHDVHDDVHDVHDVHAIASEAAELEAETEKFLDEALITDFQETPLTTMEDVLEERREAAESRDRVKQRAKELLEQEIAKEKHAREVKELEEAVGVAAQPLPAVPGVNDKGKGKSKASAPAGAPAAEEESADGASVSSLPFELESVGKMRAAEWNPYTLNLTEFMNSGEATRKARDLQAENELLKKCLQDSRTGRANAFEGYLKRGAHTSL